MIILNFILWASFQDARVSLKIFGDKGHSDFRHLNSSDNTSNKFERNRLDEFRIEAEDFGKVLVYKNIFQS